MCCLFYYNKKNDLKIFHYLFLLMHSSTTTFVTSFIDIQNDSEKSILWRFEKFMEIVKSGVPLCVYVDNSPVMQELLKQTESYLNVKIMNDFQIDQTFCYKTVTSYIEPLNIPEIRNQEKDIKNYMLLMNSKIDLMYRTTLSNPWKTHLFAWIDFSIFHISKNYIEFTQELRKLCDLDTSNSFIAIPGCIDPINKDDNFIRNILWRFCGGFFIGDESSIIELYDLQVKYFPIFIQKYKTLVWEVNFWAWLEANTNWKPFWYKGDHNDSIIQIPSEFYSTRLSDFDYTENIYDYPIIGDPLTDIEKKIGYYIPCSASYLFFKGQHLLNTRYINYTIQDQNFIFHYYHQGCGIIVTKNYFSFLDSNLLPLSYQEIEDPPSPNGIMGYNGIEDIRLYNFLDEVRFIGTSMSHSTHNHEARNLIVTGKYDFLALKMIDCQMIEAPQYSRCEKNWTPIIRIINGIETEHFIYKWSPMQIGQIKNDNQDKRLIIDTEYIIQTPIFRKFKGSTLFVNWGEVLIGVVHYSEGENLDRKYFHVLIMLDAKTLKPLKFSNNFYFGSQPGIEFCIGFAIIDMKYHFWISQNDRDPKKISIAMNLLPFSNEVI